MTINDQETYFTTNPIDGILLFGAYQDARTSNDSRTKIGARLEHLKILDKSTGKRIIGGFNGSNHLQEDYKNPTLLEKLRDKKFKEENILHAEIDAIQKAKTFQEIHNYNMSDLGLWVTDVPCDNCKERILDEKISRVVTHLPFVYQHTNKTNNSLEAKMHRVNEMRQHGVDFQFYPRLLGVLAKIDGEIYAL